MKFLKWIASLPNRFWISLEQKGKYTTFLGFCIIIAGVLDPLIKHNQGVVFEEAYMWQVIYFLIAGIILIILPSYIKISKDGIEIKD